MRRRVRAARGRCTGAVRSASSVGGDVNVVVRQGNWKGIFNAEPDLLELYDLSKDPTEQFDLSKQQAGRAEAMRSFPKGWLEACSSEGVPTAPVGLESLDEETTERLRSLGYID